jgi:hypothetical protein
VPLSSSRDTERARHSRGRQGEALKGSLLPVCSDRCATRAVTLELRSDFGKNPRYGGTTMLRVRRLLVICAALISTVCAVGCKKERGGRSAAQSAAVTDRELIPPTGKISFKQANGTLLYKLKPKTGGYKLYDGSGARLGKFRIDAEKQQVKFKSTAGALLFKIKRRPYGASLEDASGDKLLKLKREGERWKLKDGAGEVLYRAKPKADGFELTDGAGNALSLVKASKEGLTFQASDRSPRFRLSGTVALDVGFWFAAERLPIEQRAGLVVFLLLMR